MSGAIDEISHFNEYDHVLINENLQETYDKINDIIHNPSKEIEYDVDYFSKFVTSLKKEWENNFKESPNNLSNHIF